MKKFGFIKIRYTEFLQNLVPATKKVTECKPSLHYNKIYNSVAVTLLSLF